ncbi:MAG: glycosyltransferase [Bacteroidota bacterium]|nr:glycosyltransferase [Bacteroidota bacterium]
MSLLFFFVAIQLLYYVGVFSFLFFYKERKKTKSSPSNPVSIIICARNEEKNIAHTIESVLRQDYPNFEIVIVDDRSTDQTLNIIKSFARKNPQISYYVNSENNVLKGKKQALIQGISKAKYEHILLLDADCEPQSNQWIRLMTEKIQGHKQIVLGYGAYQKQNSLINKIIRYETLLTVIQYFSWARMGYPYMGVGRNLAYTKTMFENSDKFANHINIQSGDDDLLINSVANNTNTNICIDSNSFTISIPKTTFKEWYIQKRRHISTANSYSWFDKIQLTLFFISQIGFLVTTIYLIIFSKIDLYIMILLSIRYIFCGIILYKCGKQFHEKDLFWLFPLYELILVFVQISLFVNNLIQKPKRWK